MSDGSELSLEYSESKTSLAQPNGQQVFSNSKETLVENSLLDSTAFAHTIRASNLFP